MTKVRLIDKPACGCTHTLSLFCGVLASTTIPAKYLPATPCLCGKTWQRWKDLRLFSLSEPKGKVTT